MAGAGADTSSGSSGEVGPPSSQIATDFQALVVEHYEAIFRSALILCGGRQADAEDLTQQTVLQAFRKIDQLRNESAARSWFLTIARNLFYRNWRKQSKLPTVSIDGLESEVPNEIPVGPVDFPLNTQEILDVIRELDEPHRLILNMYYFENLTYREIAEILEIKIGTVMSRLSRAKENLRAATLQTKNQQEDSP